MSSSIHIPSHVFALYSLDDFNEQDFPEINNIICRINELNKNCNPHKLSLFDLIYLKGMADKDLPDEIHTMIVELENLLSPYFNDLIEKWKINECPYPRTDNNNKCYLSLRDVGKQVIASVFPNSNGIFTQEALQDIETQVVPAVYALPGRMSIEKITLTKYDGSTYQCNRYLREDYPTIFKTIIEWMNTWKDNTSSVEKYIAFK